MDPDHIMANGGSRMRKLLVILLMGTILIPLSSQAAEDDKDDDRDEDKNDVSQILSSMGYPELQVVPRASERLRMEGKAEAGSWFATHWPIELSGLVTLYVGQTSTSHRRDDLNAKQKDDSDTIALVTKAVGLAWIVGGVAIGAQRPYFNGERSLKKYNGKDERSQLLRERLAEEALERPARTMRVLQPIAVITNLTVNGLSALYTDDQGKMMAGLGVILSFLPVMFQDHNISVYDKHIEYKKKIYAPLKSAQVSTGLFFDPYTKSAVPTTTLTWNF